MTRNISPFMITALLSVAFASTPSAAMAQSAAIAQSYSGNWPLTVTHSNRGNGTYCLTLTDNGTLGWPHSGPASVVSQVVGGTLPLGTFQLINHILVVTIQQPGASGQNAALVFIAPASDGDIGKGVYEQVYAGAEFDSGVLVFGMNGGC